MIPKQFSLILAALIVMAAVSACLPTFHEPEIELRSIETPRVTLEGGTVDVLLHVYNPNRFRLDVRSVDYEMMLENAPFGTGTLSEQLIVPPRDSMLVRLPLDFRWRDAGTAGRELLAGRAIDYRIIGEVTVGTPLGVQTRPFDHAGQTGAAELRSRFQQNR